MEKIQLITISKPKGRGFLAYTESGESVFIIAEPVGKAGLTIGDKMVAVLVPHRYPHEFTWYADWAVAHGDVTLDTVREALEDLKEGGAWKAGEIGIDEGDLLYRSGYLTKYIKMKYEKYIDSETDIVYTMYPDTIDIAEFEEE